MAPGAIVHVLVHALAQPQVLKRKRKKNREKERGGIAELTGKRLREKEGEIVREREE